MFRNKRVLVTGCGSLGRELVAQLLEKGAIVTYIEMRQGERLREQLMTNEELLKAERHDNLWRFIP